MHYAIVSETYPPEINGVALTVQDLERGLRARGHTVDVVRPRNPGDRAPAAHELLTRGAALPRYPGLRFGLPAAGRLRRHWHRQRPDAVYIATEGPLGWSALRAARALGIPAATGFHTRFDRYLADYGAPFLAGPAMRWMRHFHNRADATLVPTQELRDALAGAGFARPTLLSRAVDTDRFDASRRCNALRAEWGIDADGLAVVHVGRIASEKNLGLAVRAFRALQRERQGARMVWIGDGPQRAALAAEHPDFVFRGMRRGDDLARHVASGDLFLFPSLSETFGNVTLEAMASGVATVAFNYGAAREHLRHGLHGAAPTPGDEDGFIGAACRIALEDDARREMGRRARAAVAPLRPASVAAEFDAILQRIGRHRETPHAATTRANALA
ncbi:glycosyltransferase family 1 protein [Luteimonas sp. MC1825]|uniref:glycosyltransferase family 4 protein n=1 Tax=Luteimonas sp. MC1825 TaxID=2761107 RepID=UPI00161CADC8|nr:glycosyltransferase family 1 protein [Luteimonas sp. MC1825]MBB6598851.1 glycosyltransferase family 1 protein [Luteimonas sp. MC1825]QOC89003.1 glycosyltransferase family 1 protein [Luteimonas sp. MC1825]